VHKPIQCTLNLLQLLFRTYACPLMRIPVKWCNNTTIKMIMINVTVISLLCYVTSSSYMRDIRYRTINMFSTITMQLLGIKCNLNMTYCYKEWLFPINMLALQISSFIFMLLAWLASIISVLHVPLCCINTHSFCLNIICEPFPNLSAEAQQAVTLQPQTNRNTFSTGIFLPTEDCEGWSS
jgi:hypothetical protein